ncbi:PLC-like phosphodiesterase [Tricharina praecox]|uniref:PLC-like phosphodiesterase n=1 Tax=Tricharina praecox TaxID=43433 RepID=UPI0022211BDD|nr:PLC-like phosphodiesterase [Tricharina praecox]KAI5857544.1 PLC-like phosphodiesterase [Tricharina praecox]
MGRDVAPTTDAAGGGSAPATKADLSSPLLQKCISKIHDKLSSSELARLQLRPDCSLYEFSEYLAHPENSILALPDPAKKDWSHPFNEYFISSSHNTYLVGHQLYGASTTEGYENVLVRGGRCIEIDVWDGDDGEPEVFHGYTLTKEIRFKDVCKAIKEYAFSDVEAERYGGAGQGPIIISLECHAGIQQQNKMVDIMNKVWGDSLVKDIEPEDVNNLPSPDALRGKILVKAKYVAPEKAPAEAVVAAANPAPSKPRYDTSSDSSDSELEALAGQAKQKKPKKSKVIRPLARLGAYCSSHHFPGNTYPQPFTEHPTSRLANHVYSFSEKVFAKHHETYAQAIFEHNKKYLMRVYPFGLRFSSSNADPTEFWKRGVQLVALNWQKCDEGMMLNEGMFAGEGGYVLKPPGFRPGDAPPVFHKLDLTIDVIAAANLPMPEEDDKAKSFEPYVKVEVHTTNENAKSADVKRKTKAKRGIECVWDTTLEFKAVEGVIEKLTFVRFKVHDEELGRDDLAAWACIRLDRLQEGVRLVRLFDNEGRHSKGVILVRVSKRVY